MEKTFPTEMWMHFRGWIRSCVKALVMHTCYLATPFDNLQVAVKMTKWPDDPIVKYMIWLARIMIIFHS